MGAIAAVKSILKGLGVDTRALYQTLSAWSVKAAVREQNLEPLCDRLRAVLPDLHDQYTTDFDAAEYERYWEVKMRGLHAWQVRCVQEALDHVGGESLVIADIGDSSGNHAAYIKAVTKSGQVDRIISVNLDPVAVKKVRAKGGEAILSRAEELDLEGLRPDLFLSFEMVEHLTDPVRFFHRLATRARAEHLLVSVPYRRRSRFGGAHLRMPADAMPEKMTAEEVHIYEFCPDDWRLLARFGGYRTVFSRIYLQYPRFGLLRAAGPLWRMFDFEGFLALFLERDLTLAERYTDW